MNINIKYLQVAVTQPVSLSLGMVSVNYLTLVKC